MEKIKIVGLQKSYTNRKKESVVALYKCDLSVYPNEFLVLLGESGCGKTSLLKVIAGIESYDFGEIYFDGIPAEDLNQIDKNMSYVPQNLVLFPNKTVFENIMEPLEILKVPKKDRINRVKELGEELGLSILLTRRPRELSGGQKQRVAIARALAKEPSICLFDEPLSNLDVVYHDEIIEFLLSTHKMMHSTYIYSTHNQKEAFRLGDRVAIMHNRKIEQIDTPQNIINNPKTLFVAKFLKDIYLFDISCSYESGYIVNKDIGLSFKRKIKNFDNSQTINLVFRRKDIIIDKDGQFEADVLNGAEGFVSCSFLGQEFNLPIDSDVAIEDKIRFNLKLEDAVTFVDGKNINIKDENI